MRRMILHMIATNALAAFSVPAPSVGAARPIIPVRAGNGSEAASTAAVATQPRLPPAPPPGGKILPRGSLLDLSV
ncbi:MAG: hypothetical protein M0002_18195 [Rhodospirillales bacterium]|nr:hypothetical protein [Rhodospirillales bacterium]